MQSYGVARLLLIRASGGSTARYTWDKYDLAGRAQWLHKRVLMDFPIDGERHLSLDQVAKTGKPGLQHTHQLAHGAGVHIQAVQPSGQIPEP